MGTSTIRVFVLDDHEVVRDGLRAVLSCADGIAVVGEAADAEHTLSTIERCKPDVAILDLRPGTADGIELCRRVSASYADVRCLILTALSSDAARIRAYEAGAAGYVLKDSTAAQLVAAVREIAAGHRPLDEAAARLAARRHHRTDEGHVDGLTPQERRVFDRISTGHTNREIAHELGLSDKTVKNYVSNLLAKLGVSRRAEVAALAGRIEAHLDAGV